MERLVWSQALEEKVRVLMEEDAETGGTIPGPFSDMVSENPKTWIMATYRDKNSIEMVSNFVNGVVIRKDSDARTPRGQRPEYILFYSAIQHCDVQIARRRNMERCFGTDLAHQID